jgi:hypothetical protein
VDGLKKLKESTGKRKFTGAPIQNQVKIPLQRAIRPTQSNYNAYGVKPGRG